MRRLSFLVILLGFATTVFGYKEPVHEKMGRAALDLAAGQNDFLARLGLNAEKEIAGRKPRELVGQGAFDEDHPLFHSLSHFLDPAHSGVPLRQRIGVFFTCADLGAPADQWALEDHLLMDWSLPKSRKYLDKAIVGPNPGIRDSNMRDFLLSLGHMVHLVQDMAQPEHTRNDQHAIGSHVSGLHFTAGSLYEEWTYRNLIPIDTRLPDADSYFSGYDLVKLPNYRDYFWGGKRNGRFLQQ